MEYNIILIKDIDINLYNELRKESRKLIGNVNNIKIYVFDNEGDNIPHFHLNKNDMPSTCLKILEPSFFKHGKNTGELYRKELKLVYNWLIKNNNEHWKEIIIEWNKHAKNKLNIELPTPNYNNLIY